MPPPTIMFIIMLPALLFFSIPLYMIHTYHQRKLEEIKQRGKLAGEQKTVESIAELRRELIALRDTTTQYDISFDTALQRLDSRMNYAEDHIAEFKRQSESVHVR